MQVFILMSYDGQAGRVESVHLNRESADAALAAFKMSDRPADIRNSAEIDSHHVIGTPPVPDTLGPDWYHRMQVEMYRAMRDLLGPGYVRHYYEDAAADFVRVAEGYVRDALGEE